MGSTVFRRSKLTVWLSNKPETIQASKTS
jgi:hypothetical protein